MANDMTQLVLFSVIDPVHFSAGAIPLAVYLFLLGLVNLRRRAFVTTGARDSAALAIGLIGLMVIGPMKLFFPEGAANRFGLLTWVMLLIFYGLCVSLSVLLMRSRIVIYNISLEHLRPILTNLARELDPKSRWMGDALWLPDQKVHLHVEPVEWLRNVELTAGGNQQSYESWRKLHKALDHSLQQIPMEPNPIGIPLMLAGIGLAIGSVVWMLLEPQSVINSINELLMF
jgi:hypothetical protein